MGEKHAINSGISEMEKFAPSKSPRGQRSDDLKDNPRKGVFYYVLHTVLMSASLYANKAVFELNPTMTVMQISFVRSIICGLIMILWVNKDFKKDLIDSLDRS